MAMAQFSRPHHFLLVQWYVYLVPLLRYSAPNNGVPLKSGRSHTITYVAKNLQTWGICCRWQYGRV